MTPTIYVILNKDLRMSPGKAAAQAVHASQMLSEVSRDDFLKEYRRTVIVLEGTTEQIKNLYDYLDDADVDSEYYIDEGANEVDAYSVTALAAFVDTEDKKEIFSGFKLYSGKENYIDNLAKELKHESYYSLNSPRFVRKAIEWLMEKKNEAE